MAELPPPTEFRELANAIHVAGFHAWYTPPPSPTTPGRLICCGKQAPGGGGSHCVRVFFRGGRYYLFTFSPACYDAGTDWSAVAAACIACIHQEQPIEASIPTDIVGQFGLQLLPPFEWYPIFDTARPATKVEDMHQLAMELSAGADHRPPGELLREFGDLMWFMMAYSIDGHATTKDVDSWKHALSPAESVVFDQQANLWRDHVDSEERIESMVNRWRRGQNSYWNEMRRAASDSSQDRPTKKIR